MNKTELKRLKLLSKEIDEVTLEFYGKPCVPHDEECAVCSAYLLAREFKRLYLE